MLVRPVVLRCGERLRCAHRCERRQQCDGLESSKIARVKVAPNGIVSGPTRRPGSGFLYGHLIEWERPRGNHLGARAAELGAWEGHALRVYGRSPERLDPANALPGAGGRVEFLGRKRKSRTGRCEWQSLYCELRAARYLRAS